MSTTLYRKYRPRTFAEVIGQKHIVTTLGNELKLDRIGQAYLLTGSRGTGKTTLARLFAKAVNCSNRKNSEPCNKCEHCLLMADGRTLDVIEIDAASHTGVDNIRELRETVRLHPTLGSHKIYIIDEVHMLSQGAWSALLKTLEEPPAHVIFILATTALHKVPDTIVSRCQRFDFSRLPVKLIAKKLGKIAKQEKININNGAIEMIALTAEGGMRDAESLLAQIASLQTSSITEDDVIEILGTTKKESIADLLRLIKNGKLYQSLTFARELAQNGTDLSIFCGVFLHYLHDLLLVSVDPQNSAKELESLTSEQKASLQEIAKLFTPDDIVRMMEYLQTAQTTSKTSVIPELPLEIAIVKILNKKKNDDAPPTDKPSEIPAPKKQVPAPADKPTVTPVKTIKTNIDIDIVREKWTMILNKAKQLNASLTLALSTARPLQIKGSIIVIAVKYVFHKERLNEPANRLTLANAFDSILKHKTKLRVVLEDSVSSPQPQSNEVKETTVLSPLVSQALDLLGGKLVKES